MAQLQAEREELVEGSAIGLRVEEIREEWVREMGGDMGWLKREIEERRQRIREKEEEGEMMKKLIN